MADLSVDDLEAPGTIFQIGIEPNRVDILTSVDGLDFETAWARRVISTYGGVPISLLGKAELIVNKRKVGRPQDMLDIERLEAAKD